MAEKPSLSDRVRDVKGGTAGQDPPKGPPWKTAPTRFKSGGKVPGRGTKDTVPARLTPGEFVVRKGPAEKHAGLLDKLNKGRPGATRYRSG